MIIGPKGSPDCRFTWPKVKRSTLKTGSIPTSPMSRPIRQEMNPVVRSRVATAAMELRPKRQSMKYSGGPNFRANRASIGAMTISTRTPNRLPNREAVVDMPIARPASPFWAMGYPSRVVMTAGGSPGRFIRMAAIDPPKMPPG